jgi:hypothetical protein
MSDTGITTGEYWDCADSVHSFDPTTFNVPQGFNCDRAEQSKSFFAWKGNRNGFQAAVYTHRSSGVKVLAIAGTQGMALNDILADLRLTIGLMPRQASSAWQFYQSAITEDDVAVIVGHSLGGGLAQVLGFWTNTPFLSFNAPGMESNVVGALINPLKPQVLKRTWQASKKFYSKDGAKGLNFVVGKDFVGKFGVHVGQVIDLPLAYAGPDEHFRGIKPALNAYQVDGQSLTDSDPFAVF